MGPTEDTPSSRFASLSPTTSCPFLEALRPLIERQPELTVIGEAENGLAAIELVDALDPDAVVIDLHMPLVDGVTAVARMRKDHPALCLIALTGDPALELHRAVSEAGADAVLLKDDLVGVLVERLAAAKRASSGWATLTAALRGEVAQLVEHSAENRGVAGSSPALATAQSTGETMFPPSPLDAPLLGTAPESSRAESLSRSGASASGPVQPCRELPLRRYVLVARSAVAGPAENSATRANPRRSSSRRRRSNGT